MMGYMLIAILLAAIPVIINLALGKPIFYNQNHKMAYSLSVLPIVMLKTMNIILTNLIRVFYQ